MAIFPSAVATDSDLYIAVNNIVTDLTAGIDNVVLTIPVTSTVGFPADGCITVGTEIIKYSSKTATQFNASDRGFDGTTASSHSSGDLVHPFVIAVHHNVLKDEIKAIETELGINGATFLKKTGGTMSGAVVVKNGSVSDCSIQFPSDPDTGIFSNAANNLYLAVNGAVAISMASSQISLHISGVSQFDLTGTTLTVAVPVYAPNGSVSVPSYSFTSDPNTGIARTGADELDIIAGGAYSANFAPSTVNFFASGSEILEIRSSGIQMIVAGSAAAPTYSFNGDLDTGMYRAGANILGFSSGGTQQFRLNGGTLQMQNGAIFSAELGSAASPSITFNGVTTTGLYATAVPDVRFSIGGSLKFWVDATGIWCPVPVLVNDGSVAAPEISFYNDTDTGFYRISANTIGIASEGVICAAITRLSTAFYTQGTERINITSAGHFVPATDNVSDCGQASLRWRLVRGVTITPGDLKFENDWIITEGDKEDLGDCLVVKSPAGKRYKFMLEEVL